MEARISNLNLKKYLNLQRDFVSLNSLLLLLYIIYPTLNRVEQELINPMNPLF